MHNHKLYCLLQFYFHPFVSIKNEIETLKIIIYYINNLNNLINLKIISLNKKMSSKDCVNELKMTGSSIETVTDNFMQMIYLGQDTEREFNNNFLNNERFQRINDWLQENNSSFNNNNNN